MRLLGALLQRPLLAGLRPRTWTRRWPTTPAASAASAAARGRPAPGRAAAPTPAAGRLGGRLVTTRIITGVVLAVLAVVVVVHGGLIFFFLMLALALLGLNEFYRLTRRYRPLPLAGFLGVALMMHMAWFFSPFARVRRRSPRACSSPRCSACCAGPQAGRARCAWRSRCSACCTSASGFSAVLLLRRLDVGTAVRAHGHLRHVGRRHHGLLHRPVLRLHADGADALAQEDLGGVRRRRHQHRAAGRVHRPVHAARPGRLAHPRRRDRRGRARSATSSRAS